MSNFEAQKFNSLHQSSQNIQEFKHYEKCTRFGKGFFSVYHSSGPVKSSSKEGRCGSCSGASCSHAICSYLALLMFFARQQARITPTSGKKATPTADPPTKPMFPFKKSTTLMKQPCNIIRQLYVFFCSSIMQAMCK